MRKFNTHINNYNEIDTRIENSIHTRLIRTLQVKIAYVLIVYYSHTRFKFHTRIAYPYIRVRIIREISH